MRKIIVSDASPLIALAKLDLLELLLDVFSEVHIPQSVYLETTINRHRVDSQRIHDFVTEFATLHADQQSREYEQFRSILDEGESQALALAKKLDCGVLIDERLGRRVAQQSALPVVGIMGVLLQAKAMGKIKTIRPLIEELLEHNYRLSKRVIDLVLSKAGE
jgi:predicted nucleic acid-binding protein